MSKSKIILAAVGGVSGVAIVAAGVFMWLQISARTVAIEGDEEGTPGLESAQTKADGLLRQPIRPCDESVKELVSTREQVRSWKDETFSNVSKGDRPLTDLTDAALKEFLIRDAKRLQTLPAGTTNKIVAATFEFGPFKPYISEGKMPESDMLRTLQREWDDVVLIVETLADCGIVEVTALDVVTETQPKRETTVKNRGAMKSKKAATVPEFSPASFTYKITCLSRPAAFVKTLNAFQTIDRFVVVDDFVIRRTKDVLAEALSGDKKDEPALASRGRSRSRGRAKVIEDGKKSDDLGIVTITDPQQEAPFEVVLTLTVHDFKSLEKSPKEEVEK